MNSSRESPRQPAARARKRPRPAPQAELAKRVRQLEGQIRGLHAAAAASGHHEFLTEVTHALRTPLSAMLLWVNLLSEQEEATPALREGLDTIRQCVDEQMNLIAVLADASRVVTGKFRLELRPTDLGLRMKSTLAAMRPAAEKADVTLEASVGDVGVVLVDARRLDQALTNLLTNGIQFTPRGGRVLLRVTRRKAEVVLEVTDTGEGIEEKFLTGIFDRLERPRDSAQEISVGGLGFGLAISRHLVGLHGGTIVARSGGPGKGSTFIVTMPLPALDPRALKKVPAAV